jgi:hypothetical protein
MSKIKELVEEVKASFKDGFKNASVYTYRTRTIGNSYSVCDDFTQAQLMAIWKTCKQVGMKVEVNR